MTLEQLLKKRGYSNEEVASLNPLLQNAKFRKDLEEELTAMETEVVKVKKDLDEYDNWFTNEITPEHTKLLKEHADAVAEAAASKARFEAYQRTSMARAAGKTEAEIIAEEAERKRVEAAAAGNSGIDPSKYVTSDVFNQAYEKTGEAIASAVNIISEHMQLFPGQFLDMEALRAEAKGAKRSVKDYWMTKYKVAEKKAEIATKAEEEKANKYRQEGYQKAATELGASNPNLRSMVPSNNPFVIRKKSDATKQPWERTPNETARDRVENAIKKAAERGELTAV